MSPKMCVGFILVVFLGAACDNKDEGYVWTDPIKKHCAEFAQAVSEETGLEITWDINEDGRCRLHS